MERGRIRDCPILGDTPYYLGNGQSYGLQICRVHLQGHPNKSLLKISEKRERGRIRGVPNFWVPPIISGTGKATDFKFCRNIHRVDPNKSP